MKRFLFATALSLLLLGMVGESTDSLTFERGGNIWVEGTSSLHDWDCQVGEFAGALDAELDGQTIASLSGASLAIPVQGIDCDNGTMNGKLRTALGQPPVRYTLTSATLEAPGTDGWFAVQTRGRLTIAGTARTVSMTVKGKALGEGRFRFLGKHALLMTDYGVDPPTALLGTLKTGDEVTVHFDVTVSS